MSPKGSFYVKSDGGYIYFLLYLKYTMSEYTDDEPKECQICGEMIEADEYNIEFRICLSCFHHEYGEEEEEEEVMDQFFLNDFEIIQKEADSRQESDDGDPKLQRKEAERIIKCHINYNFRPQNVEKFFEVIHDKKQLEEEVLEFANTWDIQEDRNKQLRKCKTDTAYKQLLMRYAWSDYLLNKLIEECYFDISYF